MGFIYNINPQLDVPIYRQLVDTIKTAIKKGSLASGQQLPTVQGMTEMLGVARGTVKRAYDELERADFIEKVQGRGTFVKYCPQKSGSRKEQAMATIDDMLNRLEDMGLSAAEINIFLNLKLRQRAEQGAYIKIAVVECNPENLSQMSDQLRHIEGVDLYSYLLDDIRQYPYKLDEDFDLIVTTSSHAEYIEGTIAAKNKLARVALCPSVDFLSNIIRLRYGLNIGIVGYSKIFGKLMYDTSLTYCENVNVSEAFDINSSESIEKYIADKDVVLVPKFYEKYFKDTIVDALRKYKGELVECCYKMDEGSVLYLENKIKRLLEDKII